MIYKDENHSRRHLLKLIGSAGLVTVAGRHAWAGKGGLIAGQSDGPPADTFPESLPFNISWDSVVEKLIKEGLGQIPYVGSLLSGIVSFFWPKTGEDVWDQVRVQVQQIVNQAIADNDYKLIKASLDGLSLVTAQYVSALADKTAPPATLSAYWVATNTDFLQQKPSFQLPGYEVVLLPLFAQFATMHLSLLRDGALFGEKLFNWDSTLVSQTRADLTNAINAYTTYANQIYNQHTADLAASAGTNYHLCQPFRSVNAYTRLVTRPVLDHIALWPYFDVIKYSKPVWVQLSSELYSDPNGTCDDSGPIKIATPPTKPISQITVWAYALLDAVQLTYPVNGGPNGVTVTPRLGDQSGGRNDGPPPYGGVFNVSGNPVWRIAGYSGNVCEALEFTFKDGSHSGRLGWSNTPAEAQYNYIYSYPGHILSSIHINGVSQFYQNADCIVFGFQPERSSTVDLDAARRLYIGSPGNIGLSEFASSFVSKKISTHELKRRFVEEEWERQRQEYRNFLASRY